LAVPPDRVVAPDVLSVVNAPDDAVEAPTVPLMFIEAVPVRFVTTPLLGVPRAGVTRVGLVANTFAPDPVSLVSAAANCAEVNEPRLVALPVEVTAPVRFALVVTVEALVAVAAFPPIFNAVAVPVTFVITPEAGVPKAGVTNVGLVANTAAPVPVSSVSAVASCAEVNDPRLVALPVEVTAPVRLALVVTVAAFPDMFPVKAAVIVPALKFPLASLITKVEAVFAVAWLVPVIVPFKTAVVRVLLVRVSVVALPTRVSEASGSVYVRVVPVVIPLTWNVAILVGSVSSAIVKVESTAERVAEYTLVASENTD